jgi:HemY protein
MKWILVIFSLAIGIALMSLWLLQDPGNITVTWLNYEIQVSVAIGFLFFLFFFYVLFLCVRVCSWFFGMPFRWLSSFHKSQVVTAKHELLELLSTLEAELYSDALHHQKKAGRRLSKNPLFLWISGNTFEKAGKPLEAEQCFLKLLESPSTIFLGLKGRIRADLHRGNLKSAQGLLQHAEKLLPTSPWVLKHLLAISRELKDFKKAEALTLRLEDLGYFSPDQSKKQVSCFQYQEAIQPNTSSSQKEVLLRQAHYLDPSRNEITEVFAQLLFDQGHKSYALSAIEATWALSPTQSLGDLYLKISMPKNEKDVYQVATKFVKNNFRHPESLLFLSRTAFQAKLWSDARDHLTHLLKLNPSVEAYRLLAQIELEEKHDWSAAIKWLMEGLSSPRRL